MRGARVNQPHENILSFAAVKEVVGLKWIKALFCVLLAAALFSGCSFRLASSVDELISPVSPQGEDARVQNALTSYVSGGYTLKSPSAGDYTTAFTFYDIDGDDAEEALAFYEPESSPGSVSLAVIDSNDAGWSVACEISSGYSDVYSLSFSELTGAGNCEIIVLWDLISNSANHYLSVYTGGKDDPCSLYAIGSELAVSACYAVDIDLDSLNELLTLSVDNTDGVSAEAELYSYSGSSRRRMGETKIDGHVLYYDEIKSCTKDGRVYIYADAVTSGGDRMLTEVLYWSERYDNLISPFYSYSTGLTSETYRNAMIPCRDIDGDGVIELPSDGDSGRITGEAEAVVWSRYEDSVLIEDCRTLSVADGQYQLMIPEEYFGSISAAYDSESSLLTISNGGEQPLFSVKCVLEAYYDASSPEYSGYTAAAESYGYVYLVKTEPAGEADFSAEALKAMIKTDEGE